MFASHLAAEDLIHPRAKDTLIRAPVRRWCDASYPRVEKMGEIAYGLRSHEELEFTSFLVATTRDRWGLLCLIRQGKPSNTRNINREYRRGRCNFQGCIDFQGWNQFDGILHYIFLHIVNKQYTIQRNSAPEIYMEKATKALLCMLGDKEEVLKEHLSVARVWWYGGNAHRGLRQRPHT